MHRCMVGILHHLFEIPVDKDFFDSVSKGTSIVDKFRFGSMVLAGSYGDWEMIVKDKVVR